MLQLPRAVSSTRLPSELFRAVLSVTLKGQDTKNPKRRLSVAVLPITVLPRPINIPVAFPVATGNVVSGPKTDGIAPYNPTGNYPGGPSRRRDDWNEISSITPFHKFG